jgi:hypothetical protein
VAVPEPFRVEASHIKLLNDEQARELVARLCKAECQRFGRPESSVIWGGNQRAADGGVDVSVDLTGDTAGLDFIARCNTIYQVKAEPFPPSKISNEVAPNGTIRDFFSKLSAANGAYVIVSTQDDCSQTALNARRTKIVEVLSGSGYADTVYADFYCARRLADWVEKYPSIVLWLRSAINRPITGWRGYGAWAYQESDVNSEYLVDDRVRVRIPGAPDRVEIAEAIRHIRSELQSTCAIRIVGLSGVGKTRFAQAVFDPRLQQDASPPSANSVIYCDLGDEVAPAPRRLIDDLLARKADSVIIVDNCNPSEHSRLAEAIKRPGSKVKLITIEYDIRDDLPEETSVYALEGASSDTIVRLLSRRNALLSRADAYRIAEYSDGNARVAFALASTAESTGDFATLNDADLFDRLFRQKKSEDVGLLQSAEVASLLFSFDLETSDQGSEAGLLAEIADTTPTKFRRHMLELQERGILQKRGVWRAVLPHAIANKLASKALSYLDLAAIKRTLFDDASDRVSKSLTKRLNFLHASPKAVRIATSILQEGGPAGWPGKSEFNVRSIFRNLAPHAPALAIERVSDALKADGFAGAWPYARQEYVEILAGLAYEASDFEAAFSVLVEFATCEKDKKQNEAATKALCQLSQIRVSGTMAPPSLRRRLVVGLLSSLELEQRRVGFLALSAALRVANFDFGAVPELTPKSGDYGWKPANEAETLDWYFGWLEIIADRLSLEPVRVALADALRGLWSLRGVRQNLTILVEKAADADGWPEGWLALKQILKWDKKRLSQLEIDEVSELTARIAPRSLQTRIMAFVFAKGLVGDVWTDPEDTADEDLGSWERLLKKVEALGRQAAEEPDVIRAILPDIMTKGGQNAFAFGRSLGQALKEIDWLLAAIEVYAAEKGAKDLNLVIFRGVLSGHWGKRPATIEAFLARLKRDERWAGRLIEIQTSVPPNEEGWPRVFTAIREGGEELAHLNYLPNLPDLTSESLRIYEQLIDSLTASGPNGIAHAWRILGDLFHRGDAVANINSDGLTRMSANLVFHTSWGDQAYLNDLRDHSIGVVLKYLSTCAHSSDVRRMLGSILRTARGNHGYISRDKLKYASRFFGNYTFESVDALWESVGRQSQTFLKYSMDGLESTTSSCRFNMNADQLIAWCSQDPVERFPFASEICNLFERDETIGRLVITDQALSILSSAPDKRAIVQIYVERFRPSSWSEPLFEILETRLGLFNDLKGDPDLEEMIADAEREFRNDIIESRRSDAIRERAEAQSFE